jgi:hypothetical protein
MTMRSMSGSRFVAGCLKEDDFGDEVARAEDLIEHRSD